MFASCDFSMSMVIDAPAVDARDRVLLLLAVDHVGHLRQVDGPAALLRDDDAAELRGILDLALDAHHASRSDPRVMRPAGTSWFAVRIAVDHLVDADAERRQRARA